MTLFIASVCMAILGIKRKNLDGHAQWLMASVLFVLSPGLARLLGTALILANQGNMEGVSLVTLAVPSMAAMLAIIIFFYRKFGTFRHPSFWLLAVSHAPYLFVEGLGDNPSIRSVVSVVFK